MDRVPVFRSVTRSLGFLLGTFASVGLLLGAVCLQAFAQEPEPLEVHVEPSQPSMGQVLVIEIRLPDGDRGRLSGPDRIPGLRGFRAMEGIDSEESSSEAGHRSLCYALLALRPGYRPLPTLLVERAYAGDTVFRSVQVPLRGIQVASVLPPPEESIEPPPLEGLSAVERSHSPALPLTLAGSLFFAGAWAWSRRETKRGVTAGAGKYAVVDSVGPTAFDRLRELADEGGARHGDSEAGLDEATRLLRQWLMSRHPGLLVSHTVSETEVLLDAGGPSGKVIGLLRRADGLRYGIKTGRTEPWEAFWADLGLWLDEGPKSTGGEPGSPRPTAAGTKKQVGPGSTKPTGVSGSGGGHD